MSCPHQSLQRKEEREWFSGVIQQMKQRKLKKKESSYLKETELSHPPVPVKKIGTVNGVPQRIKRKKIKKFYKHLP